MRLGEFTEEETDLLKFINPSLRLKNHRSDLSEYEINDITDIANETIKTALSIQQKIRNHQNDKAGNN